MPKSAREILLSQFSDSKGYQEIYDQIVIPKDFEYKLSDFQVIGKYQSFYVIEALEEENIRLEKNEIKKLVTYLKTKTYPEFLLIVSSHDGERITLSKEIRIHKDNKQYKQYKSLVYDPLEQNQNLFWDKIANFDASQDGIDMIQLCRNIDTTLNTEKVTKKFFAEFQKQHKSFLKLIEGIDADTEREWYASLMLNRLMFTYFIQQKGFLDNDNRYLQNKLKSVKKDLGENKFFSFYKSFLMELFHNGFSRKHENRDKKIASLIGDIPYLNGGLFDVHDLEEKYTINIPDKAFVELFKLFDKYTWYLDDKPSDNPDEINPDVLGFIFEKYINQKQMGAYYTKEDITEYISKNTVIPFLFEKVKGTCSKAFSKDGEIWKMLRQSGDKYIYDAVKYGIPDGDDVFSDLPADIKKGFDPKLEEKIVSDKEPHLYQIRMCWNTPTPKDKGLPTEIWRETIERRKRYKELRDKIQNGEINDINDFITFNLNITAFAKDVLNATDNQQLIEKFYEALSKITVLDPTCGSGAFLFAALNILFPLYRTCIEKMRGWIGEFDNKNREKSFAKILDEVKKHPNDKYYIYKTIILDNLYGVDIMHEAVEIAKLRLFLKLASCAEYDKDADNYGLEPLPDIDFNIKSGNTLVGFATYKELESTLNNGVINITRLPEFQAQAEIIGKAYNAFRTCQLDDSVSNDKLQKAKSDLQQRLDKLNEQLNLLLASEYSIDEANISDKDKFTEKYQHWLKSHQPFHWWTEFYNIIDQENGNDGFDVIIGNPPYVQLNKIDYIFSTDKYDTIKGNNLYSLVLENCYTLMNNQSLFSMIVPVSICSGKKFKQLMKILFLEKNSWLTTFSNRPGKLFDVEQRLAIFINYKNTGDLKISKYHHWYTSERNNLFSLIKYVDALTTSDYPVKSENIYYNEIIKKIKSQNIALQNIIGSSGGTWFHDGPTYWIRSLPFQPVGNESDKSLHYHEVKAINDETSDYITLVLTSSVFYIYYKSISNCRDFGLDIIHNFKIPKLMFNTKKIIIEYNKILNMTAKKCFRQYDSGLVEYFEYYPQKTKYIIDLIDTELAKHYKFTEEELDFIINYDIKYRMGNELEAYVNGTLDSATPVGEDE